VPHNIIDVEWPEVEPLPEIQVSINQTTKDDNDYLDYDDIVEPGLQQITEKKKKKKTRDDPDGDALYEPPEKEKKKKKRAKSAHTGASALDAPEAGFPRNAHKSKIPTKNSKRQPQPKISAHAPQFLRYSWKIIPDRAAVQDGEGRKRNIVYIKRLPLGKKDTVNKYF